MKLPYLRAEDNGRRKMVSVFTGYNHNRVIGDGELFNGENLSSDAFPLLSCRGARGTVKTLQKPNGLFGKDKLCLVDGTALYYGDEIVGRVEDTPKHFIGMGAYLLIFPDKLCFNTETEELVPLETRYEGEAGKVSFTENSIKTTGASFTGFKAYDGVTIAGSKTDGNNKTAVILSVADKELTFGEKCFTAGTETGSITISREVPDLAFVVESDNRLWGCAGHEILSSKLGDPFNWRCYEGLSTDSYAVTVGTDGDFTGAAVHQGYVLFFKENCIHKIYGSKPSNYQVSASVARGVKKGAEKSLCQVDDVLYYLSSAGVAAYSGGSPESLAASFGGVEYGEGVAGAFRGKYYLSMKSAGGKWNLFVLDTEKGIWHREDATHALFFAPCGGTLYYIDGENKKLKTVSGDDPGRVLWEAQFGETSEGETDFKIVRQVQLNIALDRGAFCEVWLCYDGQATWERAVTIPESPFRKTWNVPIIPRRYGHFSLKLSGGGKFLLYSVSRTVEGGSELG